MHACSLSLYDLMEHYWEWRQGSNLRSQSVASSDGLAQTTLSRANNMAQGFPREQLRATSRTLPTFNGNSLEHAATRLDPTYIPQTAAAHEASLAAMMSSRAGILHARIENAFIPPPPTRDITMPSSLGRRASSGLLPQSIVSQPQIQHLSTYGWMGPGASRYLPTGLETPHLMQIPTVASNLTAPVGPRAPGIVHARVDTPYMRQPSFQDANMSVPADTRATGFLPARIETPNTVRNSTQDAISAESMDPRALFQERQAKGRKTHGEDVTRDGDNLPPGKIFVPEVRSLDILCGRGGKSNHHSG